MVHVLRQRGLIQEVTSDELEAAAAHTSLAVYCGFDPTADSLHLGNLLGIIVLSWFQRCGHTPVALLGGATGRVGDPSGRSSERPVLSEEVIEHNVQCEWRKHGWGGKCKQLHAIQCCCGRGRFLVSWWYYAVQADYCKHVVQMSMLCRESGHIKTML